MYARFYNYLQKSLISNSIACRIFENGYSKLLNLSGSSVFIQNRLIVIEYSVGLRWYFGKKQKDGMTIN